MIRSITMYVIPLCTNAQRTLGTGMDVCVAMYCTVKASAIGVRELHLTRISFVRNSTPPRQGRKRLTALMAASKAKRRNAYVLWN